MKTLLIASLGVVVTLSGCAGYSSRTLQPKQQRVYVSHVRIEDIKIQKAAETVRHVLEESGYSVTHCKCESNNYACVQGSKVEERGFIFPDKRIYKTEVRITRLPRGYKYEVCRSDKKQEQKILDRIEEKTAIAQLKKQRVDKSPVRTEEIKIQKAAETARQVLKENRYSITHYECKSDRYACVRASKSVPIEDVPLFSDTHEYRTEIKITRKHQRPMYNVSSYWKLEEFMDFSPLRFSDALTETNTKNKGFLTAYRKRPL